MPATGQDGTIQAPPGKLGAAVGTRAVESGNAVRQTQQHNAPRPDLDGMQLPLHEFVAADKRQFHQSRPVSPAVSSNPNMMFMFCTAWPAAPFTRLSVALMITMVPVRGSHFAAISQ